jgi:hypothetical protein
MVSLLFKGIVCSERNPILKMIIVKSFVSTFKDFKTFFSSPSPLRHDKLECLPRKISQHSLMLFCKGSYLVEHCNILHLVRFQIFLTNIRLSRNYLSFYDTGSRSRHTCPINDRKKFIISSVNISIRRIVLT